MNIGIFVWVIGPGTSCASCASWWISPRWPSPCWRPYWGWCSSAPSQSHKMSFSLNKQRKDAEYLTTFHAIWPQGYHVQGLAGLEAGSRGSVLGGDCQPLPEHRHAPVTVRGGVTPGAEDGRLWGICCISSETKSEVLCISYSSVESQIEVFFENLEDQAKLFPNYLQSIWPLQTWPRLSGKRNVFVQIYFCTLPSHQVQKYPPS